MVVAQGKEKISVSLSKDSMEWLNEMVDVGIFAGKSHGIDRCIQIVREKKLLQK
ncbi:MAG: hypothetical protein ABSB83_07575 [Methanomassiliicoccales archaeon]|jgi:Arc/MetJ-type ribon-helix-helix transcriptional regulator